MINSVYLAANNNPQLGLIAPMIGGGWSIHSVTLLH